MIARVYGQAGLGQITLALTFVGMLMLMLDFGINGHLLRSFDKADKTMQKLIFNKLLGLRFWLSTALASVLFLGSLTILRSYTIQTHYFGVAVIAVVGAGIFMSANLLMQNRLEYRLSIISSSIGSLIFALLSYTVIVWGLQPVGILWAYSVGWLIIGAIALFFSKKIIGSLSPIFDLNFFKQTIGDVWPIGVTLALNTVYFRADTFLLAYLNNYAAVGLYNLAYQFFQTALVLPTFILNAYYPLMLKSTVDFKKITLILLVLAVAGTAATLAAADGLILLVAGSGYEGAALSLKILSLGFVAYFITSVLMWRLIARGLYKKVLSCYTLGLIFNLVLNYIFIPKYSFIACSIITVLSEYLILVLLLAIFIRNRDI